MIESLIEMLRAQLSNQFAAGGIAVVAFGAALAALRSVPARLWALLQRQLITTVDVADADPAFDWIRKWLAEQSYTLERARNLTVSTRIHEDGACAPLSANSEYMARRSGIEVVFSPAPGTHLIRYRGHYLLLTRVRRELESAYGGGAFAESFTFRTLSRNVVRDLILEARDLAVPLNDGSIGVMRATGYEWRVVHRRQHRSIESVVLPDGVGDGLIADVQRFFRSAAWYRERCVPYQRGYLLYGPPGSGKTSLIAAIASRFGRDVYIANLSSCSDESFANLMSKVPENGIVLLEDVDCAFRAREDDGIARIGHHGEILKSGAMLLTLSGFLNAIDGVSAPEGRLLFMTTNHADRLDAALVRPGRIDRKIEIGDATPDQARRLFQRFFPGTSGDAFAARVARAGRAVSMAELQEHLIANRDDPEEAAAFRAQGPKHSNGAEALS